MKQPRRQTSTFGFKPATGLLQQRIRKASEARGFSESRLLTHWAEIVGEATAKIAHPVDIKYGKGGFGATLTLLTTGAQAPMLEMQKDQLRDKVNACYGYRAISRVRITQTARTGFAEGRVAFTPAPKPDTTPPPEVTQAATKVSEGVENEKLRLALAALGANVLAKHTSKP